MPGTHNKTIRADLRADAAHVNLGPNPYLYELGATLAIMTGDKELPSLLSSTFAGRFARLWDRASSWSNEDMAAATSEMTSSEKKRTFSFESQRKLGLSHFCELWHCFIYLETFSYTSCFFF